MAKKPKTLLEKAGEAVDHLLHPETHAAEKAAGMHDEPLAKESSSSESDFNNHPKFAKFKSQGSKST